MTNSLKTLIGKTRRAVIASLLADTALVMGCASTVADADSVGRGRGASRQHLCVRLRQRGERRATR